MEVVARQEHKDGVTFSRDLMRDSPQVVVTACSDLNLLLWPSKQDFCAGSADTCQKREMKHSVT